jgi:DNA-binding IclR family transcriptional regulator
LDEAEEDQRYRAPALDKGLDILELLSGTAEGLSQTEIARALDRTPSEIYRVLDRLVRRDYLRRSSGDRYELTLKLFELAHRSPPMHRLISLATPVLRRFSLMTEQAVHLVVEDRNILVVIAQFDGPGYWNVSIRVGSRINLVNTGSGHVFLAFSSTEERALMLEGQGLAEPTKLPMGLEDRLDAIRDQGFENMPSAQTIGVFNLSVPIFGPMGSVLAVITCPFTQRLDKLDAPNMPTVLKQLQEAGQEISRRW